MNRPLIWITYAVLMVVAIALNIFYDQQQDKRLQRDYATIYHTALNGELFYLSGSAGFTYIRVSGSEETFTFSPRNITPGENQTFFRMAHTGDRVIKNINSDTITLLTADNRAHHFMFSNPMR